MLASLMCSFIVRSLVGANVVVINSINMFNVGMIWATRSNVPTKNVYPTSFSEGVAPFNLLVHMPGTFNMFSMVLSGLQVFNHVHKPVYSGF